MVDVSRVILLFVVVGYVFIATRYHYCCDNFGRDGHAALNAIKPGIKVWESEAHDGLWQQALITSFTNARKTAEIDWALIWSAYYPEDVDGGSGLFFAFEPWSGHYILDAGATSWQGQSPIWKAAHFCQFADPGWKYVSGADGNLTGGGAFLTLAGYRNASNSSAPSQLDFTIILQTHSNITCLTNPSAAVQNVEISLRGEWCPRGCTLQLWTSNSSHDFVREADIHAAPYTAGVDRSIAMLLRAASSYTLSTIQTAQKGRHPQPPPRADFPFPFVQDFEGLNNDTLAPFVSDNSGSFSVELGAGRGGGAALKQRVTMDPDVGNGWIYDQDPITFVGSYNWTDSTHSVDFRIPAQGPMDQNDDTPTAASLEPCFNGVQDRWTFSNGQIVQNGTCLGAFACDSSKLMVFNCSDPQTSGSCRVFNLRPNGQLVHNSSGLCVSVCGGQPWTCGATTPPPPVFLPSRSQRAGTTIGTGLYEQVAEFAPCEVSPTPRQKWTYTAASKRLSAAAASGDYGSDCLSTKMRHPSNRPAYAAVCSRFW